VVWRIEQNGILSELRFGGRRAILREVWRHSGGGGRRPAPQPRAESHAKLSCGNWRGSDGYGRNIGRTGR